MNKAYELAQKEIGTVEWRDGNNPNVVAYFRDAGYPAVTDDETAWCAAFVGAMLVRAGYKPSGKLTARSYLDWGTPVEISDIQPGDIVVIPRGNSTWQGHVFFAVKRKGAFIEGLGGNQDNAVNVKSFPIKSILGVRRPPALSVAEAKPKSKINPLAVAGGGASVSLVVFWEQISTFINSMF